MAATGERPRRLVKTPSGAEIKIGLEDECGEQLPVEIDVADPAAEPDESEHLASLTLACPTMSMCGRTGVFFHPQIFARLFN